MFRRHQLDEPDPTQSAPGADRDAQDVGPDGPDDARAGGGGPPAPTLELDRAFDQRAIAHDNAIIALRGRGVQAKARVTSLTLLYECRPDPDFAGFEELVPNSPREWSATGTVVVPGGAGFDATFLIYPTFGDPDLREGGEVNVTYDPGDRSRIYGEVIFEVAPAVRWKVPANCPQCGSPVDQSTEALAAHPTCHSCRSPLPCEPA